MKSLSKTTLLRTILASTSLLIATHLPAKEQSPTILFDFENNIDLNSIVKTDAELALIPSQTGTALEVKTGTNKPWPGIGLNPPGQRWDVRGTRLIKVDIRNTGKDQIKIGFRIDNPGANGKTNCITSHAVIASGTTQTVTAVLSKAPWILSEKVELFGMREAPSAALLDAANIVSIKVFLHKPTKQHSFTIDNIRTEGTSKLLPAETFFPFIDKYGQFIHDNWPGKIHNDSDFAAIRNKESQDLFKNFGPENRSIYGGWKNGPRFEPTGFFRTTKHNNAWWLIDPLGYLFWSHGMNCINTRSQTATTDRENYFEKLPKKDIGNYKQFYEKGWWASSGHYKDKIPFDTYNYFRANLQRKYGMNWFSNYKKIMHKRLYSWGFNTIGNWSDPATYQQRTTPYTATVNIAGPVLDGSDRHWKKFHDVYDPKFKIVLEKAILTKKKESNDPWCIGFFVDNELPWDDDVTIALSTLKSPAKQIAKKEFISDLKKKYDQIDKLNSKWKSSYSSWDNLQDSQNEPNVDLAREDLLAFSKRTTEHYFKMVKERLQIIAPGKLYLGCRFAWNNELVTKVAAQYCDVLSFNVYKQSVSELTLPTDVDKPIIIGEFHFGALDRGMFHAGLIETSSQKERADMYTHYLQEALKNPNIVGTHWFQYKDQPTTGRSDGENYQIGFIDICDSPYQEIIDAARAIGYKLYDYRSEKAVK